MIGLLRKIRKNLVKENRVSKYVLYAIGEIVLVVIGILLALQINTWKKEKANHNLKETLLENVKSDLIIQKELIEEQIVYEESVMLKIDTLNQFTNSDFDKSIIPEKLFELNGRKTFKANRSTFNNMISTGDITLFGESAIKNSIVKYYQRLDYVESVVNNNNLFMTDSNFGSFVSNNALGFEVDENGNFVTDISFTNRERYLLLSKLRYRYHASLSINEISKDLLARTEKLIEKIDEELEY
jgi:hypothetical protein